jgi:hypothetical protein
MNKDTILALIRQILTIGGSALTGSGVATSEEIATGAGAAATLIGVIWTIRARHNARVSAAAEAARLAEPEHHKIGMPPANLLVFLFLAPTLLGLLPGCTTVNTTDDVGAVAPGKQAADWDTIQHLARSGAKYAVVAILDKHPGYVDSIDAVTDSLAALFSGIPTSDTLTKTINVIAPELSEADTALIASVLIDAWELYAKKTGNPVLIPTSEHVQGLVVALTEGIDAGIVLHLTTSPEN